MHTDLVIYILMREMLEIVFDTNYIMPVPIKPVGFR